MPFAGPPSLSLCSGPSAAYPANPSPPRPRLQSAQNKYAYQKRKLWIESSLINHQSYVARPWILRKKYCQRKNQQRARKEVAIYQVLLDSYGNKQEALKRLDRRQPRCFLQGIKGHYFNQFRKHEPYHEMSLITDKLREKRELELIKMKQQSQQQQQLNIDVKSLKLADIRTYFTPRKGGLHFSANKQDASSTDTGRTPTSSKSQNTLFDDFDDRLITISNAARKHSDKRGQLLKEGSE